MRTDCPEPITLRQQGKASLLLVDDEPNVLKAVSAMLEDEGYAVRACDCATKAMDALQEYDIELVLTDIRMPGVSGLELLERIHHFDPAMPVILMTGYADLELTINAIKKSAFDFITKPLDFDLLIRSVEKAVSFCRLKNMEKEHALLLEETVRLRTLELRAKLEELESARAIAVEALRLKSEFLSNISHEIRTPMNGIIGMAELLLGTELNEKQRSYLGMLRQSSYYLLELLNGILDLSGIEAGNMQVNVNTFDPREVFGEILATFGLQARDKGLGFCWFLDEEIPDELSGDEIKLRQVIINLLGNACKFTEKGGITFAADLVRIQGQCMLSRDGAVIGSGSALLSCTVTDSGIGIPPDRLPMIFERFTQVDGSLTRQHGGCGLGLAIVREFVRLMDGMVTVKSEVGRGSAFSFSVPLQTSGGGSEHEDSCR